MMFCWNNEGKEGSHTVSLKQDSDLRGLNYYVAQENDNNESILTDGYDDSMTIIAFKIEPTESNGLSKYTNFFIDKDSYVTVEFRDNDQFLVRRPFVLCILLCQRHRKAYHHRRQYTTGNARTNETKRNFENLVRLP